MNREDLGNYFIKDGELYHCISYIHNPCMELKNIRTGQKEAVVLGSNRSKEFKRLYEVDEIGTTKPVDHINLEEKESE